MHFPPHIITRQQFRLRLPATTAVTAGMALQRQVENALRHPGLLAALDAALSQALVIAGLPPDAYLYLDHLHLDLGTLNEATLDSYLTQRLPALLLPVVAAACKAPARSRLLPAASGGTEAAATAQLSSGAEAAVTAQLSSGAEATFLAWRFFLRHGILPASSPAPASHHAWEQELVRLLAAPAPEWMDVLRQELQEPVARLRLVRQFSPVVVAQVCRALAPTGAPARSRLRQWLSALVVPRSLARSASVVPLPEGAVASEAIATALLAEAAKATLNWAAFESLLAPIAQAPDQAAAVHAAATRLPTPARAEAAPPRPQTTPILPATHYVGNAGVVLLHPFLPACFAACGWLNDSEEFVSTAARTAAVLLVHFLATGRRQASEHELLLPRLLCGIPLTDPAPSRRLSLSRPAQAEARQLLQAAIRHWQALRRTSPAGLRTAFLQRAGKLELLAPGGPELTVEQRAQDVLLSRLPYGWSVGLVQLPWLQSPLRVNWA
jgi:hypothetical protein